MESPTTLPSTDRSHHSTQVRIVMVVQSVSPLAREENCTAACLPGKGLYDVHPVGGVIIVFTLPRAQHDSELQAYPREA